MPMMKVVDKLNDILQHPGTQAYNRAARIVAAASTVAVAAEESGVYSDPDVPPEQAEEARRVFASLPQPVDQSILGALQSAFAKNAAITVGWATPDDPYDRDTELQALVNESGNGVVTIQLQAPRGDVLTQQ